MGHHWATILAVISLSILCEPLTAAAEFQATREELIALGGELESVQNLDESQIKECYPEGVDDRYIFQNGDPVSKSSSCDNYGNNCGPATFFQDEDITTDAKAWYHGFSYYGFFPIPQNNGSDKWLAITVGTGFSQLWESIDGICPKSHSAQNPDSGWKLQHIIGGDSHEKGGFSSVYYDKSAKPGRAKQFFLIFPTDSDAKLYAWKSLDDLKTRPNDCIEDYTKNCGYKLEMEQPKIYEAASELQTIYVKRDPVNISAASIFSVHNLKMNGDGVSLSFEFGYTGSVAQLWGRGKIFLPPIGRETDGNWEGLYMEYSARLSNGLHRKMKEEFNISDTTTDSKNYGGFTIEYKGKKYKGILWAKQNFEVLGEKVWWLQLHNGTDWLEPTEFVKVKLLPEVIHSNGKIRSFKWPYIFNHNEKLYFIIFTQPSPMMPWIRELPWVLETPEPVKSQGKKQSCDDGEYLKVKYSPTLQAERNIYIKPAANQELNKLDMKSYADGI